MIAWLIEKTVKMADIHDISGRVLTPEDLQREKAVLNSGGGGGTFDGMEQRVDRLEAKMDLIDGRLRGVEINLATLSERVAHLPSKGFIVTAVVSVGAVLGSLTLFADRIGAMLGG
ncbi:hypothetical protein [Yoonia vestfoldensis]|uniref:Uncharacterized protein n=1 Tax=Yoonia vestfoldensis TaxID=245188 RepID=A0A1Y0EHD0_9RHOB|nr:hypothetical protein [Yoonia vestfoldensis]ARU02994.1 hypothetical protein LOKVESSMR4R_03728 [Yoonia vestfoldensis]